MSTCRASRNVRNKVGIYSQLLFGRHIQRRDAFASTREGHDRRMLPGWDAWLGKEVLEEVQGNGIANQK